MMSGHSCLSRARPLQRDLPFRAPDDFNPISRAVNPTIPVSDMGPLNHLETESSGTRMSLSLPNRVHRSGLRLRWIGKASAAMVCLSFFLLQDAMWADERMPLHVPPDFSIERVSGPEVRFPMFAALDDRRRLYVTESSGKDLYAELQKSVRDCRIRRLEDRDGDERYETSLIFAEGLVPSMGLAWRGGKLYVADPPDLITLEDTDGDGRADKRTVILSGFGHSDNGSLHGLIFGPDGWLYLTMGEPDGFRLKRRDGTMLEGKSGALLRCRPDGSDIEVVARGFVNLVEVVFLPSGDIIGTDNWFQEPADGIRDALVHLLNGGLYPYAPEIGTPQPVTGEPLPALALYPAVALSGLEVYRGTQFPPTLRGNLFSAQHNTRKLGRHQLTRVGSTFRSTDEDFVWTDDPDFHPSDVLEDADGSLLVVDTGSWYVHHCPTGRIRTSPALGGIHRVRWNPKLASGETKPTPQDPTDVLTAELRAFGRRGDTNAASRLVPLLQHQAAPVQLAAAESLADCGSSNDVPALIRRLAEPADPHLEHALCFALFRLANLSQLTAALDHPSPRVQRAALVLLDQSPHNALEASAVVARVFAGDPALRRAAQTSLRRHPAWVEQALPVMERLMMSSAPAPAELDSLRGFVIAFAQQPAVAELLAKAVVTEPGAVPALRVALLDAMAQTSRDKLPGGWREAFGAALRSTFPDIRAQALRGVNALRLNGLEKELQSIARDPTSDATLRLQALRALTRPQSTLDPADFALLVAELTSTNAASRRLVAVEILAGSRLAADQFAAFVNAVSNDPMVSPVVVLTTLPSGKLGAAESAGLLNYLRVALRAGWQLTEAQLTAVGQVVPAERASELEQLGKEVRRAVERQHQQLVALEPLLRGGDATQGRTIFETKVGCANCHRIAGHGGLVGPDLTKIGAIRAGRDLIESIVMPSATFAQGYDTYTATLPDGETITGIRVRQADDSMVLRDASGAETRIPGGKDVKVERQRLSLMPEGLLAALNESEIRHLLAYLQSLK